MPQPTKRPLRILHLLAGSDAGGVSRYLLDLGAAMRQQGHEVIFAGQRGAWQDRFDRLGLPWIDIPLAGGPLAIWKARSILRAFLREHPVDVLHTHYRRATWLARRLQTNASPPLLYTLHLSHMPMTWARRWLTDFGDHVHVASMQARDWTMSERLATESRITYIPHGIDPNLYPMATESDRANSRKRWNLPMEATVAAYVGRLDYPKNEDWLLDVLQRCDARLLVAGTGPHEDAFRAAIAARKLTDRVTLLGELENPLSVYQAADTVLLPSLREGFSYVNAEGMSVGIPTLRTQTSGSMDLIEQNVTGMYVPINRQAFVDAAVNFLSDRNRLRTMGIAAAARAREKFTFDKQLEKTIELYRSLAANQYP
jgi:glycosyltransferase involved in cell wall biosynthesis